MLSASDLKMQTAKAETKAAEVQAATQAAKPLEGFQANLDIDAANSVCSGCVKQIAKYYGTVQDGSR